jgi:hypothetical protein
LQIRADAPYRCQIDRVVAGNNRHSRLASGGDHSAESTSTCTATYTLLGPSGAVNTRMSREFGVFTRFALSNAPSGCPLRVELGGWPHPDEATTPRMRSRCATPGSACPAGTLRRHRPGSSPVHGRRQPERIRATGQIDVRQRRPSQSRVASFVHYRTPPGIHPGRYGARPTFRGAANGSYSNTLLRCRCGVCPTFQKAAEGSC